MVGITSFGAYIPIYRLSRDTVGQAWGRGSLKGERSVANNDEDSLTMAIEAGIDCLNGSDRNMVEGLFLATTNAPYKEKLSAGLASTVLDLRGDVLTADYANSLRAGTTALRAAQDSVKAGSAKNIIVTAADCRLAYPRSDQEQLFGDGAAALMIGSDKVIASIEASLSINREIMDIWRNDTDQFVQLGEGRFISGQGYMAVMEEVINEILKHSGKKPSDITRLVIPSPDYRSHKQLAKKLGFDPDGQLQDALLGSVGLCGVAHPLMLLVSALENSMPGDTILMASYGDGADAFIFKITEEIRSIGSRRGIKGYLQNRTPLSSYDKFLSFKGILETVPGEPFRLFPSNSVYWREQNSILRCYGSRCKSCGRSIFPVQRICFNCLSKDDYEEIRYSDQVGKVFTFTRDHLAGRSDDPIIVQTVFEVDDGARFYLLMTDCDPLDVKVGLPVEFTFRRIYEGANFHNYYWKCRPLRNGGI
ncbi:MAG: 3-oxoacyl-[acyl-carrier-protein] synthase III C-terminal domain-containing protein [Thermodesulfobacteriota bacterium]|nr:3-oxoacyl-[acyl-carrier-protein] synthase III C-terminal domain-containing protein [Thermodesulfobacteriota bacterium]